MEVTIGIDLGESCCVAAVYDKTTKTVSILKNDYGHYETPCIVCAENGMVLIGEAAAEAHAAGSPNTTVIYQSMIGDPDYSVTLDQNEYTAEDLLCDYLWAFKANIETANDITIGAAVITVPPYFSEEQQAAVKRAAEKAGFQEAQILSAPAAAATAHGLSGGAGKTIMVYDLGGNTFSATVLKIQGDRTDILATSTHHQLGGKDWTFALVSDVSRRFFNEYGINIEDYHTDYQALRSSCESAKKELSDSPCATVTVQCGDCCGSYEISRDLFNGQTANLLNETLFSVSKCFEDLGSGFDWRSLDEIVTAGGASQMPQIQETLLRESAKSPLAGPVAPFAIVAAGAAMQASSLFSRKKPPVALGPDGAVNKLPIYYTLKYKVSATGKFRVTVNFASDTEITLPPMCLVKGTPPPLNKDAGTTVAVLDGPVLKKGPLSRKYTGKVTIVSDPCPLTTKFVLFLEDEASSPIRLKIVSTL